MKYRQLKNIIDRILAFFGLIIIMPLIIFIALLIKIKLGKPIFFIQTRPGYKGEYFKLIKFRSMNLNKDFSGHLLDDELRLNKFGKWLRETSIDEIPTLINIIKGEMSFVGPRPLLKEYLNLYSDFEKRRHLVKPGLTGLAQIKGRNYLSWEEKFKYDIFYVENFSFILDIKIFYITILKVLKKEGINDKYNKIVKPFKGHKV